MSVSLGTVRTALCEWKGCLEWVQPQELAIQLGLRSLCQVGFDSYWCSFDSPLSMYRLLHHPGFFSSDSTFQCQRPLPTGNLPTHLILNSKLWCWPNPLCNQPPRLLASPQIGCFSFLFVWGFFGLVLTIGFVLCRMTAHPSLPSIIIVPEQLLFFSQCFKIEV